MGNIWKLKKSKDLMGGPSGDLKCINPIVVSGKLQNDGGSISLRVFQVGFNLTLNKAVFNYFYFVLIKYFLIMSCLSILN